MAAYEEQKPEDDLKQMLQNVDWQHGMNCLEFWMDSHWLDSSFVYHGLMFSLSALYQVFHD